MIIVGIDMSKNSPGVCIRKDNIITFHSFIRGEEDRADRRKSKSYNRMVDHFELLRNNDVTITINTRSTSLKDYSPLESWKIMDASLLSETIVSSLPDDVDAVGMEGFSYGSKGNAGLDIAGYAYCVRKALFLKYGMDKIHVFSPGNVKKVAGKGNAGKEEMMEFFLKSENEDLRNTKFWKGLSNKQITTDKPVDDLVDSYYIQECTRLYLNKDK